MTQEEKIIAWVVRHERHQDWWYAPDFMRPQMPAEMFVGYEASAVISRLIKKYPIMWLTENRGKYRYARFRFDNLFYIRNTVRPVLWDLIEYNLRLGRGQLIQK